MYVARWRVWATVAVAFVSTFALAQTTITLRPTGDGTTKQWTNNAGTACTSATCYTEVNETTGSTNCTGSSLVKGNGTSNKSPATTNQTEQYTLTLSSISDNSVITAITVHACQIRGGSQSTTTTPTIIVNGTPQDCGSTMSAGTTYTDVSCAFSSLNITKNGSTTLGIGNRTNQARAVFMDVFEAEVTYHQQLAQPASASVHVSPAVAVTVQRQVAGTASFQTSPDAGQPVCSGQCGAGNNTNQPAAASFGVTTACCVDVDYPLTQTLHVSPAVTTRVDLHSAASLTLHIAPVGTETRNLNVVGTSTVQFSLVGVGSKSIAQPVSASVHISPDAVPTKSAGAQAALTLHTSPAATTRVDWHSAAAVSLHDAPAATEKRNLNAAASQSLHDSPSAGATKSANAAGSDSVHFSLAVGIGLTLHLAPPASLHVSPVAVGFKPGAGQSAAASATFHTAPACCVDMRSPFSATVHFSVGAATVKHSNSAAAASASFNTLPTCLACVTKFFTSVQVHFSADVSVSKLPHANASASVSLHDSPAASVRQDSNAVLAQSLHLNLQATPKQSLHIAAPVTLHLALAPSAVGPHAQARQVFATLHLAPLATERSDQHVTTSQLLQIAPVSTAQAAIGVSGTVGFQVSPNVGVNRQITKIPAQSLTFALGLASQASLHVSATNSLHISLNAGAIKNFDIIFATQSLHFDVSATENAVVSSKVDVGFTTTLAVNASGPGAHSVNVFDSIHFSLGVSALGPPTAVRRKIIVVN